MADFSALIDLVKPDVPSAPKSIIRSALIRSSREFCEKGRVCRKKVSVTLLNGQSIVAFDTPAGNDIVEVKHLTRAGVYQTLLAEPSISPRGQPTGAAVNSGSGYELEFNGYASGDTDYVIHLDCKPALDATTVDDTLISQWGEAIGYGAVAYLMLQKDKQWSNPDYGQLFRQRFENSIGEARIRARKGNANSVPTVRFRQWV